MKKYYKIFAIFTVALLFNCEPDDATTLSNYVGFEQGPLSLAIEKDVTTNTDIMVYASEKSSQDRSYSLYVNTDATTLEAEYMVPATVTIPANSMSGTFTVAITDDDLLGFVDETLVIDLQDEVGVDFGSELVINVAEQCLETLAKLTITTDDWPEETSWELYDLSGTPTVIASGGPYPGAANRGTDLSFNFCLSAGEYGIAVYDSYGDGGSTYTVTSGSTIYVPSTTLASPQSSSTFTID